MAAAEPTILSPTTTIRIINLCIAVPYRTASRTCNLYDNRKKRGDASSKGKSKKLGLGLRCPTGATGATVAAHHSCGGDG